MPDDYMQRLEEARDLIQLAGETPEGRAAARSWLRQVIGDVGEDEPAAPDPAADWRAAQVQAARDLGYTGIALSETGGVGIELYPDVMAAGPNDCNPCPAGTAGTVQYDNAALREAWEADEIARLGLMVQSRRPSRPVHAGLRLSPPRQLEDEATAADVVQATMDLASRISGATFRDVAEAADEIALSGSADDRAAALVSLAQRFAPESWSPAVGELDLELARQREIARVTQGAMPDEAEVAQEEVDSIVARHQDMLSHAPRKGQTALSSDEDLTSTPSRTTAASRPGAASCIPRWSASRARTVTTSRA